MISRPDNMNEEEYMLEEMRKQLVFLFNLKDSLKDLDDRIRNTALFLARDDLAERHREIEDWDVVLRPDEAAISGMVDGKVEVAARVRTMSLHGKSSFGGRQGEAMKRNLERIMSEKAEFKYLYLLDPWTAHIVKEAFHPSNVSILPILKDDISPVMRKTTRAAEDTEGSFMEPPGQMVEDIITQEEFPEDRTIVCPISRTSIRQGFLYIPKDKAHLLKEGAVKIWIRKDASLTSKCMISRTGGVRIGGGLTKWFRSIGLKPDDELIMGHQDDGSLLVLMIRRTQPFTGSPPVVETVKWN